jgi:hypothetical protein
MMLSPPPKRSRPTMTCLSSRKPSPTAHGHPLWPTERDSFSHGDLTKAVKYNADHGATFVCPACLPLYNETIADDPMTVIRIHAEAAHKS